VGDPVGGRVDLPASDDRSGGLAQNRAFVATQLRPEPGQQLAHHERLGHVVIGAGVERADLVAGVGPAGQHDDDRRLAAAAQLADDLDPFDIGEAEVEDDRVRRLAGRQCHRLPAGAGGRHVVQPGPEVDLQGALQLSLALHNQDACHETDHRPHPGDHAVNERGAAVENR